MRTGIQISIYRKIISSIQNRLYVSSENSACKVCINEEENSSENRLYMKNSSKTLNLNTENCVCLSLVLTKLQIWDTAFELYQVNCKTTSVRVLAPCTKKTLIFRSK
jgi:hypothetical protein